MAGQSITFDFISRGGPALAADFKRTGDNASAAARGAKVLQTVIDQLGQKENRTAAQSANLAAALKLTGDAEDRAAAKALAADIAIRRLDDSMSDSSKSASDARGGFAGLVGQITGFGDAAGLASRDGTLFTKAMAGLNLASGVLEPVMAGVVVAAGGLAAGFAAAGAGLGAFGIVAKSVFTQASTAATAYAAAQQKMDSATTAAQRATALQAEKAAFAGLSAPVKTLAGELGNMQAQWKAFTDAAAPGVVGVLSQGIGILTDHFGLLKPFLVPVETALHGILAQLNTGLNSSGFKSFTDLLAENTGPAITKIATAIGNVVTGIGGILQAFMPVSQTMLSGIDKITAKFREWGTTLSGNTGFQSLMQTFRTETPQALTILKNLGVVLINVGKAMFGLSTFSNSRVLLAALTPLSAILAALSKNTTLVRIALYSLAAFKIGSAFSWIPGAWKGIVEFSGAVEGATAREVIAAAATKVWAAAQAVFNAVMDANPIILVTAAAAALAAGFYIAWEKSALFRDIIKDLAKVMLAAGIVILQVNKAIVDAFLSVIGTILHGLANAFGWIPGGVGNALKAASKSFDNFKAGTDSVINGLIGNMQGWQGELNASKVTVANASAAIVKDFQGQGDAARQSRIDLATYTTAVKDNGSKSDAARNARAKLITDLEGAGVSAKGANRLVDNLQTAISNMHGKTVGVGVKASGSGGMTFTEKVAASISSGGFSLRSLAAGGRLPGYGGGDRHPALLESGETVVSKEHSKTLAGAFRAAGVPGYTSGGIAGMVPFAANAETGMARSVEADLLRREFAHLKATVAAAAKAKAAAVQAGGGGGPVSADAAAAQAYARGRLGALGWSAYMGNLISLWNQESGWNRMAYNASSGATGIPQALPYTKMPRAAWLPSQGGQASAGAQIDWGLSYIAARYGNPGQAWAHEVANNWYDRGGLLMPGVTIAHNTTGRPEQVVPYGAGGAGGVHLHLTVNGPVGSQAQLEDWFVHTANKTARTGKLTQAVKRAAQG